RRALDALAADDEGEDLGLGRIRVVAEELGGADVLADVVPDALLRGVARAGPGLARGFALARHRLLEAGDVDRAALAAQDVLGQVERKAVGVVEPEGDLA